MSDNQKTIKNEVVFRGRGLHTGVETEMILKPAPSNSGIIFVRTDLDEKIKINAILDNVVETNRGTTIGIDNIKIYTVEHVLSAIYAIGIDNLIIEINNIEPPIMDGSSLDFYNNIIKSGIYELNEVKNYIEITEEIEFFDSDSDIFLKIVPNEKFKVSFECDFQFGDIGKQKYCLDSVDRHYEEIAPARTFCSSDDLLYLKNSNLINGADINSGLVFLGKNKDKSDLMDLEDKFGLVFDKNTPLLNNKKLRYSDEPVRHKILDLIGDLALLGRPIKGHIHAYKSGHKTNVAFGKRINVFNGDFKFNKNEIKKVIPHRSPFLLIDEIIGGIPGKKVIAIKNVDENDYFFKGHFPGNPIMPGVLIIESMAQTSCFLSFNNVENVNEKMMLLSIINSSKFMKKVLPGDRLVIEVDLIKMKLGTASIMGVAKVNGKIVSKAEFKATIVNKND